MCSPRCSGVVADQGAMSEAVEVKGESGRGPLARWTSMPLYLRILVGLVLGIACGLALGPHAKVLDWAAQIILRVLGALAPALILLAVVRAIMTAEIRGRVAARLGGLLLLNTTVAILVGLAVANVLEPGAGTHLARPEALPSVTGNILGQLLDNIP